MFSKRIKIYVFMLIIILFALFLLFYLNWHNNDFFNKVQSIAQSMSIFVILIALYELIYTNKLRKDEVYFSLETESVKLFTMLINNPSLDKAYSNDKLSENERIQVSNYIACILNIFEIHYLMRLKDEVNEYIFASWVPWFYELCKSKNFKEIWRENLQKHYHPDFRNMLNNLIKSMDKEYDSSVELDEEEKVFADRIANIVGDNGFIKRWYENLNE